MLADIDRVLVDPRARWRLDAVDARLRGRTAPVRGRTLIHDTKREVADGILRSEVLRIERGGGPAVRRRRRRAARLLPGVPLVPAAGPTSTSTPRPPRRCGHRPDLAGAVNDLLTVLGDPAHPAAVRFQQTSGMVMAKGVEDTAFYRFNRLGSLTEVGGDPDEFAVPVDEFHHRQQTRLAGFPKSLTTLTTHDTKRGEDVRARISTSWPRCPVSGRRRSSASTSWRHSATVRSRS